MATRARSLPPASSAARCSSGTPRVRTVRNSDACALRRAVEMYDLGLPATTCGLERQHCCLSCDKVLDRESPFGQHCMGACTLPAETWLQLPAIVEVLDVCARQGSLGRPPRSARYCRPRRRWCSSRTGSTCPAAAGCAQLDCMRSVSRFVGRSCIFTPCVACLLTATNVCFCLCLLWGFKLSNLPVGAA